MTKKNFYIDKISRNLILSIFSKIKYKQFFLIFWFIKEKTFFSSYFSKKTIYYLIKNFGKTSNFFLYYFKNLCQIKDFSLERRNQIYLNSNSNSLFENYLKEKIFNEIPIIYLEKFNFVRNMLNFRNKKKVNIITSIEHL